MGFIYEFVHEFGGESCALQVVGWLASFENHFGVWRCHSDSVYNCVGGVAVRYLAGERTLLVPNDEDRAVPCGVLEFKLGRARFEFHFLVRGFAQNRRFIRAERSGYSPVDYFPALSQGGEVAAKRQVTVPEINACADSLDHASARAILKRVITQQRDDCRIALWRDALSYCVHQPRL